NSAKESYGSSYLLQSVAAAVLGGTSISGGGGKVIGIVVDLSVHQIDDQEYGQHIWDLLVEQMGDTGDYAIVTGGLSAANLNRWIDASLNYAKKKYPGLNLVTTRVPTDEKQQVAYQKTLDLIKAYPNLKGIIGISTPAPLGAAQAVQEKGMIDSIAVVGTSLPTDSGP
ncbi:MAG: substrate-binding domain-containing protein, partial [Candidatus Thiodiazotropha sp.]|nr:substrate-binding domain-containing protein [Candidatus Thiodiazotropha sp.]